jgi:SpoVK/Ycf46/Vps4 family AAA+-type ATPase
MANREYDGMIAVGPAGTGKTQFAKSLAGEAGRPLIILDFAGIQEKWVGSSNENLNSVFAVIKAISQGSAFWIGSCNSTGNLSPALKRRFNKGTFFFDLPSDEEKVPIWDIYLKRYEINPKQKRPNDAGWTAADIKQACETSWSFGISLIEASEYLTPVAHTDARRIEQLRRAAQSAGYLSASHPGRYVFARQDEPEDKAAPKKARTIRVEEQQ